MELPDQNAIANFSKFIVFGANGFIGQHFINQVGLEKSTPISRRIEQRAGWLQADLLNVDSIKSVLKPGNIVVNLAYSQQVVPEENIKMAENLLRACIESSVSKLIHCSTALVVGNNPSPLVNEETVCFPETAYEKTKYEIENIFLKAADSHFKVFILRPTGVVGPGGQNLKKLLSQISYSHPLINFIRTSLYGSRPLNLVPVREVVNALLHLADESGIASGIYFCAADEDKDNQFNSIAAMIRTLLKKKSWIKPIKFPSFFLDWILRTTRFGSSRYVNRRYSSQKLSLTGFQRSVSIADAVNEFVLSELKS